MRSEHSCPHAATEVSSEPSQISMMKPFYEQLLTFSSPELFFSFPFTKVPSQIFDMALNTPLSFKDIAKMTIEHFISYLRDSGKVLNGRYRYVIVTSELPFINGITRRLRKSREKNLALENSNQQKNQVKSRVCFKVFHYHQLLFCRGNTRCVMDKQRTAKRQITS